MSNCKSLIDRIIKVDMKKELDVRQLNKDIAIYLGKIPKPAPDYLRSRDAIKNARPEGWNLWEVNHFHVPDEVYVYEFAKEGCEIMDGYHILEEKAELIAVIKAVACDRGEVDEV